jgi:thiamine-monophosphate kinase
MADEFDIIARYFAPLAANDEARGLIDDVALISANGKLVVTTDAVVENVHFLADDPIDLVAKKALRVNLSDLAAKGARPTGILLTLIWPDHRLASQIADFALGLGEDLTLYNIALYGGDTTSTPGPLTISITAWGEPLGARTPSRADAKLGDDVWVTGTIGDAVLGLDALRRDPSSASQVARRYRLPTPRTQCAAMIAAYANASMDVSDGLQQDAEKIARASGVALRLEADMIPLSDEARAFVQSGGDLSRLFGGGDDYEILFTADPAHRDAIAHEGVTRIGLIEIGEGATIIDAQGALIAAGGWRHKLGA